MSEQKTIRCPHCGTDGIRGQDGQFVSNDWGRAAKYKQQRDELLAALKEYIEAADDTVRGEDGVAAMIRYGEADKQARALIAKVESK